MGGARQQRCSCSIGIGLRRVAGMQAVCVRCHGRRSLGIRIARPGHELGLRRLRACIRIGIIVAGIGSQSGVLDAELFAAIIGMSIITTLLVPPFLRWLAAPAST